MTHVTCRLTAKNRDQLRNPTLGNRVWDTFFISNQKLKKHPGHDASCAWHNTVATSSRDPSYKHKSFTQQKLLTLYLHVHCCWAPVSTLYSHLTSNSALSEYEHAKELKSTLSGSEFHTLTTCWLKTMNVFNRHMTLYKLYSYPRVYVHWFLMNKSLSESGTLTMKKQFCNTITNPLRDEKNMCAQNIQNIQNETPPVGQHTWLVWVHCCHGQQDCIHA